MLLALDSVRVEFDWETLTEENEDGSKSKTAKKAAHNLEVASEVCDDAVVVIGMW
jgi:hypothetical protein